MTGELLERAREGLEAWQRGDLDALGRVRRDSVRCGTNTQS